MARHVASTRLVPRANRLGLASHSQAESALAARRIHQQSEDSMKIHLYVVKVLAPVTMACAVSAVLAQAPAKVSNGVLTDPRGMTLYTTDRDTPNSGKSACNGSCADNWPPLSAKDGDKAQGNYTVITRDDGTKQWAYNGKPLYVWSKDKKPGDKTGDGVNKVWHAATP
jgi:predicted lipoprotein with Yx(FWY)xxD motif